MLRTIAKASHEVSLRVEYQLTLRYSSPIKVFRALTDSNEINKWGGGPSRVQARVHGDYSLWDGDIYGSIREINEPSCLIHTFREKTWESSYIESIVTWHIDTVDKATILSLEHRDIPTRKLRETFAEGWNEYFLGPLKAYLELKS